MPNANGVDNGMTVGAEKEWDLLEMKAEQKSRAILAWEDAVEWHDVAGWTDAVDDLAQLLFLLDQGRIDEALDIKNRLKHEWAKWMVDLDGVR